MSYLARQEYSLKIFGSPGVLSGSGDDVQHIAGNIFDFIKGADLA
jgi:hypothetical protein